MEFKIFNRSLLEIIKNAVEKLYAVVGSLTIFRQGTISKLKVCRPFS